jgi:3-hydroxybutyrate dehydrogenase
MLNGKNALVTGSTSGIGLGVARALAAGGCNVMQVRHDGADLSRPDLIADLVARTAAELRGLDVLVNNAGIQHTAPADAFPPEKWDAILAVNLSSVFHTTHHALPHMKRRGWGRIVNTASVHGLVASSNKVAYVAAKHGVIGLTKVVALETAGSASPATPSARAGRGPSSSSRRSRRVPESSASTSKRAGGPCSRTSSPRSSS